MTRKRFLPDYVTGAPDRHGRTRYRFRRKGYAGGYIHAEPGSDKFRQEYRVFMDAKLDPVQQAIDRAVPGTVNDLVTRYLAVPSRLGPTADTQARVRAALERFRAEHGHRSVAGMSFANVESIVARRAAKIVVGARTEGGVAAARKLRKELVRLFDFAVKLKMRPTNPAREAGRVTVARGERSKGFHTWTEAEIGQYRARHLLGARARLAMELMLWTGQRRIDAIRLGPSDIRGGRINVLQSKTGKELWLPVAPQLVAAIVAMPTVAPGAPFIATEHGKPFSNPGFGNRFRQWCDDAGLPRCTAHGLRKAMMRRLAELHMGNQSLKSVSGHSGDDEVATYTREVDQAKMADHAIALLSQWETGTEEAAARLLEAQ